MVKPCKTTHTLTLGGGGLASSCKNKNALGESFLVSFIRIVVDGTFSMFVDVN